MILNIYKVNRALPEYLITNALECNNTWDIDPGVYKLTENIEVPIYNLDDLIEKIESGRIGDIEIEVSDIIEILPDSKMLNLEVDFEGNCNYIIYTNLGCEQIAIDKEAVFVELSLDALGEMFSMK